MNPEHKARLIRDGQVIAITTYKHGDPPSLAILAAIKELNTPLEVGDYLIEVQWLANGPWVYYMTITVNTSGETNI